MEIITSIADEMDSFTVVKPRKSGSPDGRQIMAGNMMRPVLRAVLRAAAGQTGTAPTPTRTAGQPQGACTSQAVYDGDVAFTNPALCNLRLVCKVWRREVDSLVTTLKTPAFSEDPAFFLSYFQEEGFWGGHSRWDDSNLSRVRMMKLLHSPAGRFPMVHTLDLGGLIPYEKEADPEQFHQVLQAAAVALPNLTRLHGLPRNYLSHRAEMKPMNLTHISIIERRSEGAVDQRPPFPVLSQQELAGLAYLSSVPLDKICLGLEVHNYSMPKQDSWWSWEPARCLPMLLQSPVKHGGAMPLLTTLRLDNVTVEWEVLNHMFKLLAGQLRELVLNKVTIEDIGAPVIQPRLWQTPVSFQLLLPESVGGLTSLSRLVLNKCVYTNHVQGSSKGLRKYIIPGSLSQLQQLTHLAIVHCGGPKAGVTCATPSFPVTSLRALRKLVVTKHDQPLKAWAKRRAVAKRLQLTAVGGGWHFDYCDNTDRDVPLLCYCHVCYCWWYNTHGERFGVWSDWRQEEEEDPNASLTQSWPGDGVVDRSFTRHHQGLDAHTRGRTRRQRATASRSSHAADADADAGAAGDMLPAAAGEEVGGAAAAAAAAAGRSRRRGHGRDTRRRQGHAALPLQLQPEHLDDFYLY